MLRRACSQLSLLIAALALFAGFGASAAHAAATSSPGPVLWTAPGGVDVSAINAISCPSMTLCVTVDRSGGVRWSTDPVRGPQTWQGADIDQHNNMTSLSCPSTTLCVAVDGAGNVITSDNPTGGAAAWAAVKVDRSTTQNNTDNAGSVLVRGVSCPSTGLCVAVDAAGNALVTTDPQDGPSATWTITQADTNSGYGCTSGGLTCQPPLVGVSCPSTTLCAAIDFSGNILTTGAPSAGQPWSSTSIDPGQRISLWSISCPSISFCATVTGSGGQAITFNPAAPATRQAHTVTDSPYGIWCQSSALCLASAQTRGGISGLLGSFDPGAGAPTWSWSSLGAVNSVACPTPSICIAGDDEGNIAAGLTTKATVGLLDSELLLTRHLPTLATLDRTRQAKFAVTSPIAAQVSVSWTVAGVGGGRVVLGSVVQRFYTPGKATLTLRLSPAGQRYFRSARRPVTITATATYSTSTGSVVAVKKRTFTHPPKP